MYDSLINKNYLIPMMVCFTISCSNKLPPIVTEPTSAKPAVASEEVGSMGSIYQPQRYQSLFRDYLPSQVGDSLTVVIQEKASSSLSEDTRGNRSAEISNGLEISASLPFISASPSQYTAKDKLTLSGQAKANGNAGRTNNSSFVTSISVTVMDVLPNGNLRVAGEKQVQINNDQEQIRLTGVVDPRDIQPGNRISSTKLTDVRLEQQTQGRHRQFTDQGWLSRFFMTISPF